MPATGCARCGAESGVIRIEDAGISTDLCLDCSEVVTTAARKGAAGITRHALDVATTIAERARAKGVAIDRPAAAWIASEVCFFYLHVADRMAFDALKAGLRALFTRSLMDELVAGSLSHLGLSRGAPRYDEVRQQMISTLNARQVAYGGCDGTAMFGQFIALLNRFFTDAAPPIHEELTAFTAAQVTSTWRAIEPAVRQSLAFIDMTASSAGQGTRTQKGHATPLASARDGRAPPRHLPAAIRATIADGWKQIDDEGRFGTVTEARMRHAIADYERGVDPKDEFTGFVYVICRDMMRRWDDIWGALHSPSEPSVGPTPPSEKRTGRPGEL